MPFYEYQCSACGAQTEVLQKITDAPLKKCPECGKSKLAKLVSAPVFRLKGGGWYETDFKSDKDTKRNLVDSDGGKEAAAEKSEKPAEKDKPADKTESKPAAKAEPASGSPARKRPAARPATKVAPRKPAAKPARGKAKR
ncbi:MAG: zinc ribbon domain-containing protein [Pseudomonadota bacterium]|nr:zinc ribbon domain-containing protein [Pseudomonadota bacterium]